MECRRLDNSRPGPGEGLSTDTASAVRQSSAAIFPPRYYGSAWASNGTWWTDDDRTALRAVAGAAIDLEMAADHLGRPPSTVAWKAKELGIALPPTWRKVIMPPKLRRASPAPLCYPYINTRRAEHDALLRVNSMVPRGLPEWIRADVCQTIMLEVLEGKASVESMDFAAVAGFIRRVRRENGDYRLVSLDAPMGGTDLRRIDTIADDPERLWFHPDDEVAHGEHLP
jgi:hypothetical protein